ncbi:phosphatase PAP2 family protein [Clostridium sp. AM58-1XD]|uniref:phosphatase PAP2 family protein n=1 Tax=Clostridium sp. AM58-1XD TaxID=2292307 RepID=UPI000E5533BF|nr:phosphatase PAP2 family protein [Clostridium sp. AM58-1XD]RGZ00995.1 phosphatase PAP2 family protein [Clostridium sp. AM58-1XD]
MAGLDGGILLWIQEYLRGPAFTPVFQWITSLGDHGMIWIVSAFLFLCIKRTRKAGIAMFLAMFLSLLVNNMFLKIIIARTRPYEVIEGLHILIAPPSDYSFPSGHTACAVAAAAAFWMTAPKDERIFLVLKAGLLILAVLIAFSRLYLGVHYPTDVAAGAVSGAAEAWISVRLIERYRQYRSGATG